MTLARGNWLVSTGLATFVPKDTNALNALFFISATVTTAQN